MGTKGTARRARGHDAGRRCFPFLAVNDGQVLSRGNCAAADRSSHVVSSRSCGVLRKQKLQKTSNKCEQTERNKREKNNKCDMGTHGRFSSPGHTSLHEKGVAALSLVQTKELHAYEQLFSIGSLNPDPAGACRRNLTCCARPRARTARQQFVVPIRRRSRRGGSGFAAGYAGRCPSRPAVFRSISCG